MSTAAVRVEKSRPIVSGLSVVELLDRCTRQPADAVAWQEFVRRYHSTIQSYVCRVVCLRTEDASGTNAKADSRLIGALVDAVYRRLVENQFETLKRLDRDLIDSFDKYLLMTSIKVVREYFRS